eukprot:3098986-Alexandrium_andersonii.AAC.1
MSASLVGSEMCIRDSAREQRCAEVTQHHTSRTGSFCAHCCELIVLQPVSYTHLTLPTICSV